MVEYVEYEEKPRSIQKKSISFPRSYVMPLIIINIIVFILQITISGFTDYFILDSNLVFSRPWTLVTTFFLHGSFSHLFFNMYALLLFGILLESKIGPKRFLGLYLIIGFLVSCISPFFYTRVLGASGAIMGVIGTLIVLMPRLRLYLFFIIPLQLWQAGILWFLLDTFGIFVPSSTANIGHIVGMLLGLIYGFYLYKKKKKFFKKFKSKKHIDINDAKEYSKHYK